jgi:hypothetical protein
VPDYFANLLGIMQGDRLVLPVGSNQVHVSLVNGDDATDNHAVIPHLELDRAPEIFSNVLDAKLWAVVHHR